MADKLAMLKAAKAAIKKKKLNVHEVKLDLSKPTPHLSTGNPIADYVVGGNYCPGLVRGHFTEVYGPESSGKTTFLTQISAWAVKNKQSVLYLDYEHSISARYAKRLGLDLDSPYFMMYQPVIFEEAYWYIKFFLKAQVDLIVVDSLAAMTPKRIMEAKDMEKDAKLGEHARPTSLMLQRATAWQKKYSSNTAVVFVNQIRSSIDTSGYGGGGSDKTTGGKALRFYCAVRLKLQPVKTEKHEWMDPSTGIKKRIPSQIHVKLTNVKNKVSDRQGFSDLLTMTFGKGFDTLATAIDVAVRHKLIVKGGSWYTLTDDKGKEVFRVQGKGNTYDHIAADQKLRDWLINEVRNLLIKADEEFLQAKGGLDTVEEDYKDGYDEFADDEYDDGDPFGDDEYDSDEDEDEDEGTDDDA